MTLPHACCTCATILSDTKVPYDPHSEKPLLFTRRLECCSRDICALCQYQNPRFQSYCPFCQISTGPTALPKDGLRLPPSYSKTAVPSSHSKNKDAATRGASPPPSYHDSSRAQRSLLEPSLAPPEDAEDTVHFVSLEDSLPSLSIAYSVPISVLRQHNNLYSDSLLTARKWILIPRSHYTGPSLSTPPDPDEEERKIKLRRWMVATKCADYAVATLYLKGSDYNLDIAVGAFKADEEWERTNPLKGRAKGKEVSKRSARGGRVGGSLSGQLS
ncbi:uncharacterized protein A1O9_10616 [Exophiala aquamarina CBS 119918]|uniref:LysM domain-containing protein n=1 Tax=Exophiala aquamarina CBS 119918 TaxID=1182545 RepID=A0A072P1L9_9EURO|nr:uncharacterized protein A1O9_10616 [Exophiala aquamarina CBS 119918]KEF53168.1 hypothetical protein A1O9_10616 [Exophiala aquamarina CBS 119918]